MSKIKTSVDGVSTKKSEEVLKISVNKVEPKKTSSFQNTISLVCALIVLLVVIILI